MPGRKKGESTLFNLFQPFKKWWQRITDTKPKFPEVKLYDMRIENRRAQILTKIVWDAKEGFSYEWSDLLTHADKAYQATCPKCKHRGTLYDFKWNLDNPVVPLKKGDEQ